MKRTFNSFLKVTGLFCLFLSGFFIGGCKNENQEEAAKNPMGFETRQIADTVRFLWARCLSDVTGDGITDLVFSENNAYGGILGYYTGTTDSGLWELTVVNDKLLDGKGFATGDLECADMDFDGDADIVAARHPGEWKQGGAPSQLYWYENPGWQEHYIGEVPDFVKDLSLADFDLDRKMDVVAITFEESSLSVFRQKDKDDFEKVLYRVDYKSIHEGLDVGDLDGDSFYDIVANGYIFYNPRGILSNEWKEENLDEIWNNQEGDWSRNATKVFIRDIDADTRAEVFMSHSERPGYPLAFYRMNDDGSWTRSLIADSIAACHSLQVFDFDLDGDYDVLAGMNKGRAAGLGYDSYEVFIFLSENNYQSWIPRVLDTKGIYNAQAADYDNDGDYDIFRYYSHDETDFFLMENTVK